MTLDEFKATLQADIPDKDYPDLLKSLWHDGKGDWESAHAIADGHTDKHAEWVHAYLHRKEGDNWNANYWYRRAGRKMPACTLEEEWTILVTFFLQ